MDYVSKLVRKISIKGLFVHIVGLIVSMSIIWGVSYLILVTFSIQENTIEVPTTATSTLKKATQATSTKNTASTTKSKAKK